jgi:hypothetical protein
MSRCPPQCCTGCRDEIREERKVRKTEARKVAACLAGDLPELIPDDEDDEEDDYPDFEEGDRMFAAGLHHPSEEIRATSTISQRLAEAFKRNTSGGCLRSPTVACGHQLPSKAFRTTSGNSMKSSQRNPSMSYQTLNLGITPLNWSLEPNRLDARCTHSRHLSRRN